MNPKPASKTQVKEWKKLLMGKYRKKNRLFLAEGIRCVEQILQNRIIDVAEILVKREDTHTLQHISIPQDVPLFELSRDDFAAVSDTETPQGVLAVCGMPGKATIEDVKNGQGTIVALDAIRDPGNLGTIIRTASWFGAKAMVFGTGCADPFHPKVVRSTAGATGAIPWLKGDLEDIFNDLEPSGWQVYLLDGSTRSKEIRTIKPDKRSVIVIGNEANGITSELFSGNRISVRIPGNNRIVESLNASVACTVALHHFYSG